MTNLKADVNITFVRGGKSQYVSIEIFDEKSGKIISLLKMSPENFTKAITGQAYVEAEQEFTPTEDSVKMYGKKREIKEFYMKSFNGALPTNEEIYDFIVDVQAGSEQWTVRENGKGIKQQTEKGWRMVFERYVD